MKALTLTYSGLVTIPTFPGTERQPSCPCWLPSVSTITGLMIIIGLSASSETSITAILFKTPICGAASPTPWASYIVSSISSIKDLIFSLTSLTSFDVFLRMSSPITLIFLIAITIFSSLLILLTHVNDTTPICRVLSTFTQNLHTCTKHIHFSFILHYGFNSITPPLLYICREHILFVFIFCCKICCNLFTQINQFCFIIMFNIHHISVYVTYFYNRMGRRSNN